MAEIQRAIEKIKKIAAQPNAEQMAESELREAKHVRADAITLIHNLYSLSRNFQRDFLLWHTKETMGMANAVQTEFQKEYERKYRNEVTDLRRELLAHINNPPTYEINVEQVYGKYMGIAPITAVQIEQQLIDLRLLTNTMEAEHGLPLSCQDLKLWRDLP